MFNAATVAINNSIGHGRVIFILRFIREGDKVIIIPVMQPITHIHSLFHIAIIIVVINTIFIE
jgi:hypothetical protein